MKDRAKLEQAKARYDAHLLRELAHLLRELTRHRNLLRRHVFYNHNLDPPDMLAIIVDRLGDKRFRFDALTCAYLATL